MQTSAWLYLVLIHAVLQCHAADKRAAEQAESATQPSATPSSSPTPTTPRSVINTAASPIATHGGNSSTPTAPNNPFAGKPTFASYSNDIPPAYLTWKKPVPNQTFPPLFKIGASNITFEWTVDPDMLKVQPENLTVALANPQKQTYTAAIVPGSATSANWNLAKIPPGQPLMMGYYTVWVYDQRGPKAFPSPGWLMPDSRLVVAMYSTEAYVGRTDSMFCPTCYLGAGAGALRDTLLPWGVTLGVALCSSLVMMLFILY
ncbi:hypothetical protein BJV82DRAFT_667214 [Fennellomyces sp. T-0311]|nr:hypothetical protein BJV82DRAFT_667214 [Fennellomyces sp. T-0311]